MVCRLNSLMAVTPSPKFFDGHRCETESENSIKETTDQEIITDLPCLDFPQPEPVTLIQSELKHQPEILTPISKQTHIQEKQL
ncbi:hypothetical protein Pan161_38410 [Gimesia algae]|uniref:Uncharacterized protein n=1 Tax=Gimesia algae TaxID=2527971 RepID=A0A517VGP1_9PLAN|nr:hypothetical protein Pan161_38410 [Gimesia algae]